MGTRSSLQRFHIPAYGQNAVLQLIALSGVGFVAVRLVWITLIVYAVPEPRAFALTFEYVGMGNLPRLQERWWTILTYGWCHRGFWEWLSNMLWLFLFGNLVQSLVGYKQVIPVFVWGLLGGGLVFAATQLLPGQVLPDGTLVMGAYPGILALMCAALALAPRYRIYFSDYFSVPLWVPAALYVFLLVLNTAGHAPHLACVAAGGAFGAAYVALLRMGYRPGTRIYGFFSKLSRRFNPPEARKTNPQNDSPAQQRIDRILDKINERGYAALSEAEKEELRQASR